MRFFALFLSGIVFALAVARAQPLRDERQASVSPELARQIGQLFIFGIPQSELDPVTLEHLKANMPGAFILFRRNLVSNKQTAQLINQIQDLSLKTLGTRAFVAVDQEGGSVFRLPFYPSMPSPWAVGQTGQPELGKKLGFEVGKALQRLGFNMNLAPVLDVGTNSGPSFLGSRAFSSIELQVAAMGIAFSEGLLKANVIPVAKHFPGMGNVVNDPHVSVVRRSTAKAELMGTDLMPFRDFSRLAPTGIMLSHLVYPELDPSLQPATYSKPIVSDVLLGEMGYKGLVITDDMMMEGSSVTKDFQEHVVRAFEAGCDIIMVSWSRLRQRSAIQGIANAIRSGRLKREDVQKRIDKVVAIKKQMAPYEKGDHTDDQKLLIAGVKQYQSVIDEIFEANFKKQVLENQSLDRSLIGLRKYYLMPHQARYLVPLTNGSAIAKRFSVLPNNPTTWKNYLSDGAILYFVRNSSDAKEAQNISEEIWSHTLVVNQLKPVFTNKKIQNEIQILMYHTNLWSRLTEWLGRSEIQISGGSSNLTVRAQLATSSSQVAQDPNLRRSGTRSTSGLPEVSLPATNPANPELDQ